MAARTIAGVPMVESRETGSAGHAAAYDEWFDKPWGRYAFAVEAAALAGGGGPVPGGLVLDAGCGTGRFSTIFADTPATPIGVDLDPDMLRIARSRLAGRCARASLDGLPFPDDTFEVALAVTVLEFVADPAATVAELARVTRPGGRVIIGALNPRSPWGLANRGRLRSGAWCHARFLTRRELATLGARHGRVRLHAGLYAPGPLPRPGVLGPVLETIGRAVPYWGAFQVLTITRNDQT